MNSVVSDTRRGVSQISPIELTLLRSALDQGVAFVSWDAVRLILQLVELPTTSRSWEELCWLTLRAEKNVLLPEYQVIWEALSHEDEHSEKLVATLQTWLIQTRDLLGIAPVQKPIEVDSSEPVETTTPIREKVLLWGFVAAIACTVLIIVLAFAGTFKKSPRTKAQSCSSATCSALNKPIALFKVS